MGIMQNGEIRPIIALPFQGIQGEIVDAEKEAGTYRGTVIENGTGATISNEFAFFIERGNTL